MKKIAYIIAGAALLGLASCTHKQLGEVGMCEKDLLVKYNWDEAYEQARGDFQDPMDNFLSDIYELNTHVMPLSTEEHIDTTLVNDVWGNTRPNNMDVFKKTLFPARSWKDRAHFTGVYDIFVTNLNSKEVTYFIDTTDMHNSIPTNFEFRESYNEIIGISTGISTKVNLGPEEVFVPGMNDLPFGDMTGISQLPRIYYGSKKGVVVTPGVTEHEVAETEIMMKKLKSTFIRINFKTSVNCEAIGVKGGMDSFAFLITGLAQNYDLLNDKPIGGYNYFDSNPRETQDGLSVSTDILGISPETGKCEAVLFGAVEKYVDNDLFTYFVYKKADITKEILNCKEEHLELELFQDTMTLPSNAVPSPWGKDLVWNEMK
ncbi:MAG: hypothetical protein MJZ07_08730 [Bacteroidales bacterium]|nr:hypothetical protein [Bacteroidales bacterium]